VKVLHRIGLPFPRTALLETTGRKSGEPRRTPVGKGLLERGEALFKVGGPGGGDSVSSASMPVMNAGSGHTTL
jgi:hypothetical protein